VGGEAQAGSKTSVEKDHWSPYCKRSLQKKDGRGSAETVGGTEKSSSKKTSQKGCGRKGFSQESEAGLLRCWNDGFTQISFSIACI
jgi:hypothetical protein